MACNCNNNRPNIVVPSPKQMVHGAVEVIKTRLKVGLADDATVAKRRDICRECPDRTINSEYINHPCKGLTKFSQCLLCKCVISEKTKRAGESCPKGLWKEV